MNTKSFLDQLLRSGSDLLQNQTNSNIPNTHHTNKEVSSGSTNNLSALLSGQGGAALAGGALGLLLGSKSGRKMGGKVLTYGGLAVIGTLAYQAFQNYKKQSSHATRSQMKPLELLPVREAEEHCKVILIALIAASKADGHIDAREKTFIDAEVSKMTNDPVLQDWFEQEIKKPLDPAEVAKHSENPAMASEMYLASLLAADQQNFMEKAYLDELARQLNLPSALQAELALQARQAMSKT